jgi:hypothetical protein
MPQRLLMQTFGRWHSGKLRTARRERPSRVASVGQDPNSAAPVAHFLVLAESQDAQRTLLIVVRRPGRDLHWKALIDFMKDKVVSWCFPTT